MADLDWYRRTMTGGNPIPPGVTVSDDGRAEQSCEVCEEWVDAAGFPFSATRCAEHLP